MPALTATRPGAHARTVSLPLGWWWGFALYAAVSAVHVGARFVGADAVGDPTKLLLMPALAAGVVWATRDTRWGAPHALLLAAIALSWLGDGAGSFFPFAPELPMMLLCFGLAHLAYIWLFQRHGARRRVPMWALIYAVWWIVVVLVLWPHLGGLAVAVAAYGLVLGGTATTAARCHPLVAVGGALFLTSDTILAFRLFTPELMPPVSGPLVMLTYCAGQGLIAIGLVVGGALVARRGRGARTV